MSERRPLRKAATIWLERKSTTKTQAALLFQQVPKQLAGVDVRIYAESVAASDPRFAAQIVDELLTREVGECVVLDAERPLSTHGTSIADQLREVAEERGYAGLRFLRHADWVAEGLANVA